MNIGDTLTFKSAAKPRSKELDGSLASRRDLLMGPLLAALPLVLLGERAEAAPDPTMTIVKLPADIPWVDMFTTGEGAKIYAAGGKIVSVANLYSDDVETGNVLPADKVASGLHERPALVRNRPSVRRRVGNLVGHERRCLRSG